MPTGTGDEALLPAVVTAVQSAGSHMKSRFSFDSRLGSGNEILAPLHDSRDGRLVRHGDAGARQHAGALRGEPADDWRNIHRDSGGRRVSRWSAIARVGQDATVDVLSTIA